MTIGPLREDGSTRIREFTTAEYEAMLARISKLYQDNPVVTLSVVGSGGNISPSMEDFRYRSGTAARNTSGSWPQVTSFPGEGSTGEPERISGGTYDRVSQTITAATAYSNSDYQSFDKKPVMRNGDGIIQEMSLDDLYLYFITPITSEMMKASSVNAMAGGSFFISTSSSVTDATLVSGTPVFSDTRANISAYTASQIGTAGTRQDHFSTTNYYLQRVNTSSVTQGSGYRTPLIIDGTAGLRHMTYQEFDDLFEPIIRHAIYAEPGQTLRYNFDGNGTTQGSVISNRELVGGNGNYTEFKATEDDYRAQEFPNGTLTAVNNWRLKLERT